MTRLVPVVDYPVGGVIQTDLTHKIDTNVPMPPGVWDEVTFGARLSCAGANTGADALATFLKKISFTDARGLRFEVAGGAPLKDYCDYKAFNHDITQALDPDVVAAAAAAAAYYRMRHRWNTLRRSGLIGIESFIADDVFPAGVNAFTIFLKPFVTGLLDLDGVAEAGKGAPPTVGGPDELNQVLGPSAAGLIASFKQIRSESHIKAIGLHRTAGAGVVSDLSIYKDGSKMVSLAKAEDCETGVYRRAQYRNKAFDIAYSLFDNLDLAPTGLREVVVTSNDAADVYNAIVLGIDPVVK